MKTKTVLYQLFLITLLIFPAMSVTAQQKQMLETQARSELQRRGITEEELRIKLAEKGIDLNDLNNLTEAQALQMQDEIKAAINEIEIEKANDSANKNKPSAIDDNNKKRKEAEKLNKYAVKNIPEQLGGTNTDSTKLKEGDAMLIKDSIAIWGQHIFRNKSLALYRQANDIKPPLSYVLGVGDQITITIWGVSQLNDVYEINEEGYITPERMPRIFLKGVSLGRAKSILNNYFKRFYRFNANQFEVAVNYSRTINVNIFGEVYQYGGFTLPAINTAFNALVAAGGPTNLGSVRRIKLIRKGITTYLDVYKFMEHPVFEKDHYLENNDVIQVPVADKVISIQGAVNRPFKYELLANEDLNQLIVFAGGLKDNAIRKTIQIERIQNDKKLILDVPYADLISKGGDFLLKRGDKITVFEIQTGLEDFIFVKGAVRTEASYQYKSGLKLSELIRRIEFLPESNLQFAFIKRKNKNNSYSLLRVNIESIQNGIASEDILLNPEDEIIIYRQENYVDKSFVIVEGAARHGGKFELKPDQDVRIKDLVLLAGGLKPDAFNYAFLFRAKNNSIREHEVIRINIRDVMDDKKTEDNIFIKPYDSLVILTQTNFNEQAFVEISGAIKSPGKYAYGTGMTARDLISLANGFTYFAATNKIDIFRVIIKNNEPTKTIVQTIVADKNLEIANAGGEFKLDPYDIIVVRSQPEFQFQQLVQVDGEVMFPGPYALLHPNEKVSDIIQRAGGLTLEAFPEGATLFRPSDNIGYVVLDLKLAMIKPTSRYNFILKESDVIFVPKQKDLVRIAGATNAKELYPEKMLLNNNTISVAYHEGRNAKFYINQYAAGVSSNGDPDKITVEHANGKLERTKDFLFFRSYPSVFKGSVINVGYKDAPKLKIQKEKKDVDWAKVVADTIGQATAILSLILLIDRL
jgi:protein involved in polysaccharide export with SLBB domain